MLISEKNYYKRRQSLVYFCDPDGEKFIQTVAAANDDTGASEYINYNTWRNKRFRETSMIQ